MAYVLPNSGTNGVSGEGFGFEKAIANFAIRAVHESQGLVNMTTVVTPTQGNQFEIPLFAPITYGDYNPNTNPTGNTLQLEQNPTLGQNTITATPAVAATAFDIFYGWTTAFNLAAALGSELGESFAEKVDQRVTNAYTGFKVDGNNTYYASSTDGFQRPTALGAITLLRSNTAPVNTAFEANTVLGAIRLIKQNFKNARLPGSPMIVLDTDTTMTRLLGELTGGAVATTSTTGGTNLSMLGNELLERGEITNVYGCRVMFSTFLQYANARTVTGGATTIKVGAYVTDQAIYTVMKQGLDIKMGEKPGGLQMWLTGVGYFGSGVGDGRRGGAVNIVLA